MSGVETPNEEGHQLVVALQKKRSRDENDKNYSSASAAHLALAELEHQSDEIQLEALRSRQADEFEAVRSQFKDEVKEVEKLWDRNVTEYDDHVHDLKEELEAKHKYEVKDLASKFVLPGVKFSKEVLNLRTVEERLVKQKRYAEAQTYKDKADRLEKEQTAKQHEESNAKFMKRMENLREKQSKEVKKLEDKITATKKSQQNLREQDMNNLILRFENVMNDLENQHGVQRSKLNLKLKKRAVGKRPVEPAQDPLNVPSPNRPSPKRSPVRSSPVRPQNGAITATASSKRGPAKPATPSRTSRTPRTPGSRSVKRSFSAGYASQVNEPPRLSPAERAAARQESIKSRSRSTRPSKSEVNHVKRISSAKTPARVPAGSPSRNDGDVQTFMKQLSAVASSNNGVIPQHMLQQLQRFSGGNNPTQHAQPSRGSSLRSKSLGYEQTGNVPSTSRRLSTRGSYNATAPQHSNPGSTKKKTSTTKRPRTSGTRAPQRLSQSYQTVHAFPMYAPVAQPYGMGFYGGAPAPAYTPGMMYQGPVGFGGGWY